MLPYLYTSVHKVTEIDKTLNRLTYGFVNLIPSKLRFSMVDLVKTNMYCLENVKLLSCFNPFKQKDELL
jgi:hypothetical protein